jgi:hypothetical protein
LPPEHKAWIFSRQIPPLSLQNALCTITAKCNYTLDSRTNFLILLAVVPLAYLMLDANGMLDLSFLVATVAFFALSLAYVQGCQRL